MMLNKYKLGELIEKSDLKNKYNEYKSSDVRGISINKCFAPTKADAENINLSSFKIVKPGYFAFNTATSRNGEKISIAYNDTCNTYIVSSLYDVFKLNDFGKKVLNEKYLFMFFNRQEFDRYARCDSWGSAREYFRYSNMCDVDITLPSLEIQNKYVEIYKGLVDNQKSYESRLVDLKKAAIGSLENTRSGKNRVKLGDIIEQTKDINSQLIYSASDVKGMTITKQIIPTKANTNKSDLSKYLVIHNGEFIYNPRTHGKKIGLGFNNTGKDIIISWNNIGFRVKKERIDEILPEYLYLIFTRDEWDRRACYDSWGSSTEVFSWNSLCDMEIEIPSLDIQKYVSMLNTSYLKSYSINEKLIEVIKNICPILIKGSLEDIGK